MESIRQIIHHLGGELLGTIPAAIIRLIVAAILGGAIGLERELRRKPAGLRTNMFICFGAAMFTILSDSLAGEHAGDHTRIAAQIIPGIGFIGAGSILHARGSVTGLTTAATLFVVASVGMAAGGGLYLTATFATVLLLLSLSMLGKLERSIMSRSLLLAYEVIGPATDSMLRELNRILETRRKTLQNVHTASSDGHSRILFSVEVSQGEQKELEQFLRESSLFSEVKSLGPAERE